MREIIFDTETTGFEPNEGHRIVEIGCIETIDKAPTGRTYHQYINPERSMPAGAFEVHGLSEKFLKDFPVFADVAQAFVDFVGDDSLLVAHNATFDLRFINAELGWVGLPGYEMDRVVDTLAIAKKKFPGSPASLDALCRRFNVDNSDRALHGALLDARLLAGVYYNLTREGQKGLDLNAQGSAADRAAGRTFRPARSFQIPEGDLAHHQSFIQENIDDPIWSREG